MTSLHTDDIATIQQFSATADRAEALTKQQIDLIHRRDWLKILAPRHCGGAEMPLPEAVRLQEAIARADGSLGWLVTLCAGAGWFGGFLAPEVAREILDTDNVCFAGSGAPNGTAEIQSDSYLINGRWDYATGAAIASHFTFNAMVQDGGQAVLDEAGAPAMKAFVVPASAVEVIANWQAMGMKSSSTHSFQISNQLVPARYSFTINPAHASTDGPLYQFPFLAMALVTFAANISGMAEHFLTLADGILRTRKHPLKICLLHEVPEIQAQLATAFVELRTARNRLYDLLDNSWQQVCDGQGAMVDNPRFHSLTLALVTRARQSVDSLYPLCGLQAADLHSDINRVWRDFHTATQHSLLLP